MSKPLILLTGATGYVGGRLLRSLRSVGHRVRCLARRPEYLASQVDSQVDVVRGDVLDRASLERALEGVGVAYYLVHSMGRDKDFEATDRQAARNFGEAAKAQGVGRLIYLGGLGSSGEELSPHLSSRHEVGEVLRQSGVDSSGLVGLLYWYAVYPLHALVFRGMLRAIARQAEAEGAGR